MIRRHPLPAETVARLETLSAAYECHPLIVFAYLFGSGATGDLKPLSDIDVAVYLDEVADPVVAKLEVIGLVTEHLRTDEVDIVVLNDAPTALIGRVLGSRRVIVDRTPFLRHRFESRALREFFDFRIVEHRLLSLRFGRQGG